MHPNHTACKGLLDIVASHLVKYLWLLRQAFVKARLCPWYSVVVLCWYTECDQSLVPMHPNHTTCKGQLDIVASHSVKYLWPLRQAFVKAHLHPCYSVVLCCYGERDQSLVSMHPSHATCKEQLDIVASHSLKYLQPLHQAVIKAFFHPSYIASLVMQSVDVVSEAGHWLASPCFWCDRVISHCLLWRVETCGK